MTVPRDLRTERLHLRRWVDSDRAPFAAMSADARVATYLMGVLTRQESDALVDRILDHFEQHGFGVWAVEIPNVAPFAGYIGLAVPNLEAHFTPCVEIAWRLAFEHWGHGYATEGAKAVLTFGFDCLRLEKIVAYTASGNERSRRLMQRIGMRHDPKDDFKHPLLPTGHRLSHQVLYRVTRPTTIRAGDARPVLGSGVGPR